MALVCREGEAVQLLELLNCFESLWGKGSLVFKGVQHDSFEQMPERHVLQFGDRLENFQQPLFDADSRLDSFDPDGLRRTFFRPHWYQCTYLPTGPSTAFSLI